MAKLCTFLLLHVWTLSFLIPTIVPMEFAMRQENVTGYEGDTVIMTCKVVDKDQDRPVYWQRYDGSSNHLGPISRDRDTSEYAHLFPDLSPRLEIVGDESRGEYHLLISNLSLQDNGRFVCTFFNERGYGVYAPITYLSVLQRTRVAIPGAINPICQATVSSPLQAVSVGTTVELVCNTNGRPDITSVEWYVGTVRASNRFGSCVLSKHLPQRICTFRRTLTLDDIGVTFTCIAIVGPSEQQRSRGLTPAPSCSLRPLSNTTTVMVQPTSNRVTTGETATFFCTAGSHSSLSRLRYTWFLNNDQQLSSVTSRLMISSTSGYLHDNHITCVVSDHFGFLGHGNAVLIVEMSHNDPTTHPSLETTTAERSESITSVLVSETYSDNSSSINILKPPSKPNDRDRQATVFPLVLVISLASGAVLMAVLLVVATACIIRQKKQGHGNLDDKVIQLETVHLKSDPTNVYSKINKSRPNSKRSRAPSVNEKPPLPEPVAGLCNNNKVLTTRTYAVLDPDQVDNDSLSSLDLQSIINNSEGSPQDNPDPITAAYPKLAKDIPENQKASFESGNSARLYRGRSASTPGGPVTVYAGKKTHDSVAVAYAVTNIVEDRKWPAIAENNETLAPALFYDNNRITGYAASSKGKNRKRAMSSPMVTRRSTDEVDASTANSITSRKDLTSQTTTIMDDTCAYAEISELTDSSGNANNSRETNKTEPNGGAVSTVPEPPFPRSYLRSDNAYAITRVVSLAAKP